MDLAYNLYFAVQQLLQVLLTLIESGVRLDLHLHGILFVVQLFVLLGYDGIFSGKLHFDLLSLDVVESDDIIPLVHLTSPSHEFSLISLMVFEILQSLGFSFVCLL